ELLLPWSDVLQRPMDLVGVGDGEDLRAALQRPLRTDEEAFERGLVPAQAREIALDELDLVLAGHGDIGVLLVMAAGGAGVLGRAAAHLAPRRFAGRLHAQDALQLVDQAPGLVEREVAEAGDRAAAVLGRPGNPRFASA